MADESFNDVMGHAPVYSSGLPGVSVTNPAEFKEWHGRVRRAHEREVRVGVAGMTDAQLAEHGLCRIGSAAMWDEVRDTKDRELSEEHGLVRLPVDADGVRWTGEEHFFQDAQVGGARFLFGLSYFGDGKWEIIDHYQNEAGAAPAMCRHISDVIVDQHAELAAGLMDLSTRVADMDAYSVGKELREYADRLREMDGDDGKEQ